MSTLTFNPDIHEYRIDGERVPSVTEVMAPCNNFSRIDQSVLEYSADRGTKVHEACELFDEDDLDEDALDPVLRPYVEAYKRFLSEADVEVRYTEQRVWHSIYRYAGTADRIVSMGRHRGLGVLDLKTTASLSEAVGIQLAAYQEAWNALPHIIARVRFRLALQLRRDGTYSLRRYEALDDWAAFRGLLAFHNWQRNHA